MKDLHIDNLTQWYHIANGQTTGLFLT